MSSRNAALISLGIPLGTLAVVAGCSGGGSVAGTVPSAPAATQPGQKTGPTVPVTILIQPPKRNPASRRTAGSRKANYQIGATASGFVKIGFTVFAGSSTPLPAPTETVFTLTVPTPGASAPPTPYAITINVPVGSADTFVINEYNGEQGAGYPDGYLLSTYTSATPIPIYENATNHISITTSPVAATARFLTLSTPFFEYQATTQTSSVGVVLLDVEGNTITGPVANPAHVTATIPTLLTAANVPIPQSTAIALFYPSNSSSKEYLTATVQGGFAHQYISAPASLLIQPDFYLFVGSSDTNVRVYDGLQAMAGTASLIGAPVSVGTYAPARLAGVVPACGAYLAQAIVGVNDTGASGHTVSVVNLASAAGPLTVTTAPVGNGNTTGVVINPGSCTGYGLTTTSAPAGYLFSLMLGSSGPTAAKISPSPASTTGPANIAIDNPATTLITSDSLLGYLNAFTIAPPANGTNNNSFVGSSLALVEARGHIFQMVSNGNGYLFAYSNPSAAGVQILSGSPFNAMVASPFGDSLFVATGSPTSTISYFNNSSTLPTGVALQTTTPGVVVTAMVVSPNGVNLFVAESNGNVVSYPIATIATSGFFSPPRLMLTVPGTATSLAVSP